MTVDPDSEALRLLRELVKAIPWEQSGQCSVCGGYSEEGEHHGGGCSFNAARAYLAALPPSDPAALRCDFDCDACKAEEE